MAWKNGRKAATRESSSTAGGAKNAGQTSAAVAHGPRVASQVQGESQKLQLARHAGESSRVDLAASRGRIDLVDCCRGVVVGCAAMTTDHEHAGFDVPAGSDPLGRPVDGPLLGAFIGAAFDGCTSCQNAHLTIMVQDAPTTARLVELACIGVHQAMGGLPANLTDADEPGTASREFRVLAAAGADGGNAEMWARCAEMTPAERRAAANTAADLLVGLASS